MNAKNGNRVNPLEGNLAHAPWCVRFALDPDGACSCDQIPALQCNVCRKVFEPAADETALDFGLRVVRGHALTHAEPGTTFTQGVVERRPQSRPEGTE